MKDLRVTDVMEICNVSQTAVQKWITKGYLKATKIKPDKRNSALIIQEDDLKAFMRSENYTGHPEDIIRISLFNRIPFLEECYPINLLIQIHGVRIDVEDNPPFDIWEYDIKQFRHLITLLTDREQRILEMRYQLGMTLDEIGKTYNLTRERIRMIQALAERKLKHWMINKGCRVVSRDMYNDLKNEYDKLKTRYEVLEHELMQCKTTPNLVQEETSDEVEESYKVKLEDLDFVLRGYNCLKRAGFNTLGDLIFFDRHQGEKFEEFLGTDWYSIRNLGRKSLMDIAKKVFDYCGYRLRDWRGESRGYVGLIPICEDEAKVPGGVGY